MYLLEPDGCAVTAAIWRETTQAERLSSAVLSLKRLLEHGEQVGSQALCGQQVQG